MWEWWVLTSKSFHIALLLPLCCFHCAHGLGGRQICSPLSANESWVWIQEIHLGPPRLPRPPLPLIQRRFCQEHNWQQFYLRGLNFVGKRIFGCKLYSKLEVSFGRMLPGTLCWNFRYQTFSKNTRKIPEVRSDQNNPRVIPECSKGDPRVILGWSQSDPRVILEADRQSENLPSWIYSSKSSRKELVSEQMNF